MPFWHQADAIILLWRSGVILGKDNKLQRHNNFVQEKFDTEFIMLYTSDKSTCCIHVFAILFTKKKLNARVYCTCVLRYTFPPFCPISVESLCFSLWEILLKWFSAKVVLINNFLLSGFGILMWLDGNYHGYIIHLRKVVFVAFQRFSNSIGSSYIWTKPFYPYCLFHASSVFANEQGH